MRLALYQQDLIVHHIYKKGYFPMFEHTFHTVLKSESYHRCFGAMILARI
jgi:hypothetical protein